MLEVFHAMQGIILASIVTIFIFGVITGYLLDTIVEKVVKTFKKWFS